MNNRTGLYVLSGTAAVAAMFTKPMIAARETGGDTGAEARTDASSLLHTRVVEEAPSGYVLAEVYPGRPPRRRERRLRRRRHAWGSPLVPR